MRLNKQTTLCYLIRGNEVCLGIKKREIGMGNWNGVGGKMQKEDKTIVETMIREAREEIGVRPVEFKKMGVVNMYYLENQAWNQKITIFVVTKWKGKPKETAEERTPKWWPINKLPYHRMWQDDPFWLPAVLAGLKVKGKFIFDQKGKIKSFEIKTYA